jgi:hypothetical protein
MHGDLEPLEIEPVAAYFNLNDPPADSPAFLLLVRARWDDHAHVFSARAQAIRQKEISVFKKGIA